MGTRQKKYILETDGSGVGLIDYDNDGWLDIYLVNGSTYDALSGKTTPPHAALFHNNHDGTFTDVAAKAGVTNDRWGFGVAIGDYDNDGWPDIFVCNFGKNRLYHNNHDGTFTDVAEKAGVTLGNWSDGATWGDYDGDGRLDLFVSGYVHYDLDHQPTADDGTVALRLLPASRRAGDVRPARLEGRARSSLPQQRRRHIHRRQREGRRLRPQRLLRLHRHLCGREQRRQSRPAGGQRLRAQLPLHQQGRRHLRRPELCLRLCAQQGRPRDRVHGPGRRRLHEQRPASTCWSPISPTTSRRSITTTATPVSPMLPTRPASRRWPSRLSAGATAFSTSTTMAGKTS